VLEAPLVAGGHRFTSETDPASDVASLLSGMPRDERWDTINLRALSLAAQVLAVTLVAAFLITQFQGGDAIPYALMGGLFGLAYLGGIAWYRVRS